MAEESARRYGAPQSGNRPLAGHDQRHGVGNLASVNPIMGTPLVIQLLFATGMVTGTVLIHLVGLGLLMGLLRHHAQRLMTPLIRFNRGAIILGSAMGLFALHTLEIWLYAIVYVSVHAIGTFEAALYYSTATYTTVGYGDALISRDWRIFGAIEGANGIILLGWSTAFFVSVVQRLRAFEQDWLGASKPGADPPP